MSWHASTRNEACICQSHQSICLVKLSWLWRESLAITCSYFEQVEAFDAEIQRASQVMALHADVCSCETKISLWLFAC